MQLKKMQLKKMNKQGGFIQGALLIGIALLAVVIGAFALASSNNTSDVNAEKTKTNASVAVKKMADMMETYQIIAAQQDVTAAEAAVANDKFAAPVGASYASVKNVLTVGSETSTTKSLTQSFAVGVAGVCPQIDKILGHGATAFADAAAMAAAGATEGCVGTDASGSYTKVIRAAQ